MSYSDGEILMTKTNEVHNDIIIFRAHILLEELEQDKSLRADSIFSMATKIASPSLAAKNKINLISVLTIW